MASEDIYLLTPSRWNPHDPAYAANEDSMVDWEGNMREKRDRVRIMLNELEEDPLMAATVHVSSAETQAVDSIFERSKPMDTEEVKPVYQRVPRTADQIGSVLAEVSPILNDECLYERMASRAELGRFAMSIGSTNTATDGLNTGTDGLNAEYSSTLRDGNQSRSETTTPRKAADDTANNADTNVTDDFLDELYTDIHSGEIDLDEILCSSTHAAPSKGTQAAHLAKIWRIDLEAARRTLEITSQHGKRTDDPKLSRNYGTNDRMLRYKRINQYFFMDTFFSTKKAGKSSRGHTCCQLFVTDKGFVYVVPMRTKSEVYQAVKQFAKEIGAPAAIICDMSGEQTSRDLKRFLLEIGTTLRVLEEGTPWSNKAELYIGLIKEAVRKDMKDSNCPLAFWDYCVERRARINNLTAKNLFSLHGSNAHTDLTGEEGDISNISQYAWYQWCYFRDKSSKFPFGREVLGRILGPARGEGNEMAQGILKQSAEVVPRRSHRPLKIEELHSSDEKKQIFEVSFW